jgi:hypothetical protein
MLTPTALAYGILIVSCDTNDTRTNVNLFTLNKNTNTLFYCLLMVTYLLERSNWQFNKYTMNILWGLTPVHQPLQYF